ncbi:MAG TPA: hypothetical protein VFU47_07065, partial [Armatimonadota bacterium]|nr:hypothetical protein [Armatimonadota bacterium]
MVHEYSNPIVTEAVRRITQADEQEQGQLLVSRYSWRRWRRVWGNDAWCYLIAFQDVVRQHLAAGRPTAPRLRLEELAEIGDVSVPTMRRFLQALYRFTPDGRVIPNPQSTGLKWDSLRLMLRFWPDGKPHGHGGTDWYSFACALSDLVHPDDGLAVEQVAAVLLRYREQGDFLTGEEPLRLRPSEEPLRLRGSESGSQAR